MTSSGQVISIINHNCTHGELFIMYSWRSSKKTSFALDEAIQRIELLPVWREIGMGFFLYEWRSHEYRKKNFLTNHEWLSRRDEIKIPHARRSRKWGIFILSQLLSHDVMSEEIYPSLFLSRPGVTFPFLRGFIKFFFAPSTKICSIVKVKIDCFQFIWY